MYVDHIRREVGDQLQQRDFRALAGILTAEVLQQPAARAGVSHTSTPEKSPIVSFRNAPSRVALYK